MCHPGGSHGDPAETSHWAWDTPFFPAWDWEAGGPHPGRRAPHSRRKQSLGSHCWSLGKCPGPVCLSVSLPILVLGSVTLESPEPSMASSCPPECPWMCPLGLHFLSDAARLILYPTNLHLCCLKQILSVIPFPCPIDTAKPPFSGLAQSFTCIFRTHLSINIY